MRRSARWGLAGIVLLAVVVVLGIWLRADDAPFGAVPANRIGQTALPDTQTPSQLDVVPALPLADDVPLPAIPATEEPAQVSMSMAREHGDARAPAVVRAAAEQGASTAELADPRAYQRYELRQSQRLQKAYVQAADTEIPRLQQDIERARREGLSPEQIAEGEEKLRRIQAMRDQLQAQGGTMP